MKISDAELEVMQVIWDENKMITSNIIIQDLKHKKWKNNTIKTLIKRLLDKGAIYIIGSIGTQFLYVAAIKEEDYQKEQLQHFVDTVLRGDKNKLKLLGE